MPTTLHQPAAKVAGLYCPRCGRSTAVFRALCAACGAAAEAERRMVGQLAFRALCPAEMRDTDFDRLPDKASAEKALAHDFSTGRSLLLRGGTGRGKTRVAWLLVRRAFEAGQTVRVLSTASGYDYAAQFAGGSDEVGRWVGHHLGCDLLLLDDVFKCKLTDSFESLLFALVDKRCEQRRPLLVTTNDVGETMAGRMAADRGEPLVRRLRDYCDFVVFKTAKTENERKTK